MCLRNRFTVPNIMGLLVADVVISELVATSDQDCRLSELFGRKIPCTRRIYKKRKKSKNKKVPIVACCVSAGKNNILLVARN